MKGEIVDINKYFDSGFNERWQVVIDLGDKPSLKMGDCEVKQ